MVSDYHDEVGIVAMATTFVPEKKISIFICNQLSLLFYFSFMKINIVTY